jgi:hypothetical protein
MKLLLTTSLALWGAVLVSGCAGGAGPATPFNPFGTDPSGSRSEPPGGSNNEAPPPSGGGGSGGTQTLAQLCAAACAQIESSCPTYQSTDCATGCTAAAAQIPNCQAEYEAFVSCVATAYITCNGQTPEFPGCTSSEDAVTACQGGTVTSTGGAT